MPDIPAAIPAAALAELLRPKNRATRETLVQAMVRARREHPHCTLDMMAEYVLHALRDRISEAVQPA